MEPVGRMDGDSLPVSAFVGHEDGQFEQGASAYEKRGVAVSVPKWESSTCIQCNQCSFVCPHATIRPYALTDEEIAAAPENLVAIPMKGKLKDTYRYTLAISPLDCMGCGVCIACAPPTRFPWSAPRESLPSRTCSTTALRRWLTSPRSRTTL